MMRNTPTPDPTPIELAERIAAVRDSWSDKQRKRREAVEQPPWSVPVCDAAELRRTVGESLE